MSPFLQVPDLRSRIISKTHQLFTLHLQTLSPSPTPFALDAAVSTLSLLLRPGGPPSSVVPIHASFVAPLAPMIAAVENEEARGRLEELCKGARERERMSIEGGGVADMFI